MFLRFYLLFLKNNKRQKSVIFNIAVHVPFLIFEKFSSG